MDVSRDILRTTYPSTHFHYRLQKSYHCLFEFHSQNFVSNFHISHGTSSNSWDAKPQNRISTSLGCSGLDLHQLRMKIVWR